MKQLLGIVLYIWALSLICVRSNKEEYAINLMLRARICNAKPEYGHCKGHTELWYFHPRHNRCEIFVHSNCGGNRNRFYNEDHCINFCRERILGY
ncbi:kunitz-type serine protease inhibitor 2-like [Drosophila sulfurigaster albostrigata]|uniref:kunitz-type serine protease inhibitor 2-like n=1 Tax=Drosophila sulfurigaster albostrigata TaxID=89887 RepID=UPI002D21C3C6|nr:kunitz-type serine protease inhibitor 2-like [Drosophila sulfurigaster albostrigata]